MDISFLDLRRKPAKLIDALERCETVTLSRRGKPVARIEPIIENKVCRVADHPAFGAWANRPETADPAAYVRNLRKGRFDAL